MADLATSSSFSFSSSAAGTAAARIEGLTPATQYEYRVLGVDNEGKFSPPSDLLQVALPAVSGLPGWVWLFLLGGALALGVLMLRRIQEQRTLGV